MRSLFVLSLLALVAAGCGSSTPKKVVVSPTRSDCVRKGITSASAREGACVVSPDKTITVANRTSWLHAKDYDARVTGVRTARTLRTRSSGTLRTQGKFVILTMRVKNTGTVPRAFDKSSGLGFLLVDKRLFRESRQVESGALADAFRSRGVIQPGGVETGTIAFDLPAAHAGHLYARGSDLVLLNVGDEGRGLPFGANTPPHVGFIRLWK